MKQSATNNSELQKAKVIAMNQQKNNANSQTVLFGSVTTILQKISKNTADSLTLLEKIIGKQESSETFLNASVTSIIRNQNSLNGRVSANYRVLKSIDNGVLGLAGILSNINQPEVSNNTIVTNNENHPVTVTNITKEAQEIIDYHNSFDRIIHQLYVNNQTLISYFEKTYKKLETKFGKMFYFKPQPLKLISEKNEEIHLDNLNRLSDIKETLLELKTLINELFPNITVGKNEEQQQVNQKIKETPKDNQPIIVPVQGNNQLLFFVQKIYELLSKKKEPKKLPTIIKKEVPKNNELKLSADIFGTYVIMVSKLNKEVSKEFVLRFQQFQKSYAYFVDKKNQQAFNSFFTGFSKLLINVKKAATEANHAISMMMTNMLIITFIIRKGQFKRTMMSFRYLASGINLLVIALLAMAFIPLSGLLKVLGFLVALAFIAKKLSGDGKNSIINIRSVNNSKKSGGGLFGAAIGLSILVLAISSVTEINFDQTKPLIMFMLEMAGIILLWSKIGKKTGGGVAGMMLKFALGLTVLLLAVDAATEVNWKGALIIGAFIIGIGIAIGLANRLSGKGSGKSSKLGVNVGFSGMFGFALGLSLLVLAVDASNELNWSGALQLIAFITAIAFAISLPQLISRGRAGKQAMGGMLGFAFGLGILVLAIDAMHELNWGAAFFLITFLGGLGLVMRTFPGMKSNPKQMALQWLAIAGGILAITFALKRLAKLNLEWKTIFQFFAVVGGMLAIINLIGKNTSIIEKSKFGMLSMVGSLVLMIWAFTKIGTANVQWSQIIMFGLMIGFMYVISNLIAKNDSGIKRGALTIMLLAGTLYLAGLSVASLSNINYSWGQIGKFGIAVLGIAALAFGASFISTQIIIGSIALLALGAAMWIVAQSVSKISNISYSWEQLGIFSVSVLALGLLAAGAGLIAPIIILGSATLGVMGLGLIIVATSMALISKLTVTKENIDVFGNATKDLTITIAGLIGYALVGAIAVVPLLVVATGTLVIAAALEVVSLFSYNPDRMKQFGKSIVSLMNDGYGQIGVFATLKAVAKAGALIPIAVSTLIVAAALKAISALDIQPVKMQNFGNVLKTFLNVTIDAINEALPALDRAKPGLDAVAKLGSAARAIAEVVENYANMKIAMYKYNEQLGKMEIVDYKPVDDAMIAKVGAGIGQMMVALIKPLSIISGEGDTWNFGDGIIVQNPFGKRGFFGGAGNTAGVKRVEMIANAFKDIPKIISGLLNNEKLLNGTPEQFDAFKLNLNKALSGILDTLGTVNNWFKVNKLDLSNIDKFGKSVELNKNLSNSWTIISKSLFWSHKNKEFETVNNRILFVLTGMYEHQNKLATFNNIQLATTKSSELIKLYTNINDLSSKLYGKQLFESIDTQLNNIKVFITESSGIYELLENTKPAPLDVIRNMDSFYTGINKISSGNIFGSSNIEKLAIDTRDLMNELSNSARFNTLNRNLEKTDKNIRSIVTNVNKINIDKATALERNLRLLAEARTLDGIRRCIEELTTMIGYLKEVQEQQVKATNSMSSAADNLNTNVFGAAGKKKSDGTFELDESKVKKMSMTEQMTMLIKTMTEVSQALMGQNNHETAVKIKNAKMLADSIADSIIEKSGAKPVTVKN